jgi:hypothetical protein
MATSSFETNIDTFIVATKKRYNSMADWPDVEENLLKKEVTKAVKAYLAEAGFTDVKHVSLKKLFGTDGNLLIKFEALMSARKDRELFLVTVDANHQITTEKVKESIEQNNKFEALFSELRRRTLADVAAMDPTAKHTQNCLVLYGFAKADAKVMHFIGGLQISEGNVIVARLV